MSRLRTRTLIKLQKDVRRTLPEVEALMRDAHEAGLEELATSLSG
ncbi:hypothetical protein [Paraburkholderia sp. BL23I1N1]|nr:hypothetical protein [Paraburkholderia sp. BL23I1N1]